MIARPWKLPEAIWAVSGAVMLVVFGLLPWSDALKAVAKGIDVYLFLSGMMLLAELARKEGFVRFSGRASGSLGGRLRDEAVRAGLWRRHSGYSFYVERRYGGRSHSGRVTVLAN